MKINRKMIIVCVIMLIISMVFIDVKAEDKSNIEKIQELYRLKGEINKEIEVKEKRKAEIVEIHNRLDQGVCTREDIIFKDESSNERLKRYIKEVKDIDERIDTIKIKLKTAESLIETYNNIISNESKTTIGLVDQYTKISKNMGGTNKFIRPLENYRVSSPFGNRVHPITGEYKMHTGIDLAIGGGTPIKAIESGEVIKSGRNSGYGNTIIIMHRDDYFSMYAHIQEGGLLVKEGEKVVRGQKIGLVGTTGFSTGNHLHLEILKGSKRIDPSSVIKF